MKKTLILVGIVTAAVTAAGAAQAAPGASSGCPGNQVFAAIDGDLGSYVALVGGDLEGKAHGVRRSGDAKLVKEQDTLALGDAKDRQALRIREGGSASFHQRCDKWVFPEIRFASANTGGTGTLEVSVRYTDAAGVDQTVSLGSVTGSGNWEASPAMSFLAPDAPLSTQATGDIEVTFTAVGPNAEFLLDDVYIDPRVSW
jgi:hypothetical protein